MSNQYNVNDLVKIKIESSCIKSKDSDSFEDAMVLKIVGSYDALSGTEYVLLIPEYETSKLKAAGRIDKSMMRKYGIDPIYHNENYQFCNNWHVVKLHHRNDGEQCSRCREFFPMAQKPNNGNSFLCFLCREYPYR